MIIDNRKFLGTIIGFSFFLLPHSAAMAGDKILDEVRFGVSGSIQPNRIHEAGAFASATLFVDPLGNGQAEGFWDNILHPRLHGGAIYSLDGEADQMLVGLDWQASISKNFFIDVGLGGAIHTGDLKLDGSKGPKLGSRVLFHEYIAAGIQFDDHWRLLGTIEHSSNADLAPPNDGLSYGGISIGYKF